MYSQLLRGRTASRSNTGFSLVGPTKVKARKSLLFTKKFRCTENKEHMVEFLSHLYFFYFASIIYFMLQRNLYFE